MRRVLTFVGVMFVATVLMISTNVSAGKRGGGGGGGGSLGSITISNVKADGNLPSGVDAYLSWATNPTDTSDTIEFYESGNAASFRSVSVGQAKQVQLTGLKVRMHYDFLIKAVKSGYTDGGYVGSFYTTDLSDSIYEKVDTSFRVFGCNPDPLTSNPVEMHYRATTTGDVAHDHSSKNKLDHSEDYVYTHFETPGLQCNPDFLTNLGLRHVTIRLYAYDTTDGFKSTDSWILGLDMFPKTSGDIPIKGFVDQYLQGLTVSRGPISISVAAGSAGCTAYDYHWGNPTMPGALQSDGGILLGWVDIEWNPCRAVGMDVTFLVTVADLAAQPHYLHGLRLRASYTFTFASFVCPIVCLWVFTTYYDPVSLILGDGVAPNSNSKDQLMDLQDGSMQFSGWS